MMINKKIGAKLNFVQLARGYFFSMNSSKKGVMDENISLKFVRRGGNYEI